MSLFSFFPGAVAIQLPIAGTAKDHRFKQEEDKAIGAFHPVGPGSRVIARDRIVAVLDVSLDAR